MRARPTLLPLLTALLLGGCAGEDDRPATWGYLSPAIFQPSCATGSCHNPAAAASGLDLSDPDRGYTSLTLRPLLIPFDPDQSRLVNMLRARGAPRMPPDRPLPERTIRLVESWILDGARRTADGPPAVTPDVTLGLGSGS